VAALLPSGFKPLLDETGKATLVATVRSCDLLWIDRGSTNATTWSDVGILIEPYGGVLGTAIYQFWGAANTTDLAEAFTVAGFPQQVSPDWMAWSWAADPAAGIWSAGLHADPGLATIVAPFGGVTLVPMPSHAMHGWHHEGGNLVHIDYGLDPLLAAGTQTASTITAPPGSALERLLGQSSAVATTSLVVLSMDARVSVT
jgi:phage tail protein X